MSYLKEAYPKNQSYYKDGLKENYNFNSSGSDELYGLSPIEKRDFYKRLSQWNLKKDPNSLAGQTLEYWLTSPTEKLIVSNDRLKILPSVNKYLINESRQVFLSQLAVSRDGSRDKIRGVKDRLLGLNGHTKWDGASKIEMEYLGPSLELVTTTQFELIQKKSIAGKELSFGEKIFSDVYTSFHSSGVESKVVLDITEVIEDKEYKIKFDSWKTKIVDNYNWDSGYLDFFFKLTLPNPDYKNPFGIKKPIAVKKKFITIKHNNARDVENAGLASPYDFETKEWNVTKEDVISDFTLKL